MSTTGTTPETTPATTPGRTLLSIRGMTCEGCVTALTRVLARVPGVSTAHVDLARHRAEVEGGVPTAALIAAVRKAGYDAEIVPGATP